MSRNRKHMKLFNVARGYCHKIAGVAIPHGAFYGRDSKGYWYCINKTKFPIKSNCPALELYRLESNGEWVLTVEMGDTVKKIFEWATLEEWAMPIEYPKYKGLHVISANMDKTIRKTKGRALGRTWRHHNELEVKSDVWENAAPMTYAEYNGRKCVKNRRYEKAHYTENSKPYYTYTKAAVK